MEASYLLCKKLLGHDTWSTWLCGPYTIHSPCLRLLKPSPPRLLISQPLVVLSFNVSAQTSPHHRMPATCLNGCYIAEHPFPPSISLVSHSIASFLIWSVVLQNVLQLLVTAYVVPSLLIHSTLMIEVICVSVTLVLTRAMRCQIPEDGILHCLHLYWNNEKLSIHNSYPQ
jgi:hypothetical protein